MVCKLDSKWFQKQLHLEQKSWQVYMQDGISGFGMNRWCDFCTACGYVLIIQ